MSFAWNPDLRGICRAWAVAARRALLGAFVTACACPYPLRAEEQSDPGRRIAYLRSKVLNSNHRIAVIGDVQRTSFLECCVAGRELNDEEQRTLLADLVAHQLKSVVLLGDMAFHASVSDWNHFDFLMQPLRERGTEFIPVMGNHDYWGGASHVAREIGGRFGDLLQVSHYSVRWGEVRLIVLDGNRERLCQSGSCQAQWNAQLVWLRRELEAVETSRLERGALVFVHQSPFTQSPLVQGDRQDARELAEVLLRSKRGLAMISAHAHGFERYSFRSGPDDPRPPKHFIVSAGGGGPRPSEREPGAWPDDSLLPWPRPFNYLILSQDAGRVQVTVRALEKGGHVVRELAREGLELPFQ